MAITEITITEDRGVFVIEVSWNGGRKRLAATIPTGDRAAYPEAVVRNRNAANTRVAEFIAKSYPDASVIDNRE